MTHSSHPTSPLDLVQGFGLHWLAWLWRLKRPTICVGKLETQEGWWGVYSLFEGPKARRTIVANSRLMVGEGQHPSSALRQRQYLLPLEPLCFMGSSMEWVKPTHTVERSLCPVFGFQCWSCLKTTSETQPGVIFHQISGPKPADT